MAQKSRISYAWSAIGSAAVTGRNLARRSGVCRPTVRIVRPSSSRTLLAEDWFDRVFEIGIIGQGLNGAAELIRGVSLLLLTPTLIHRVLVALTQRELSEDPRDFIAGQIRHSANGLTSSMVLFGASYLLTHGIVKVALVTALLLNKVWAYPWMIFVLIMFIGYQLYRIALNPSAGLIALTVFELIIVALTGRQYRQQFRRHPKPAP